MGMREGDGIRDVLLTSIKQNIGAIQDSTNKNNGMRHNILKGDITLVKNFVLKFINVRVVQALTLIVLPTNTVH